MLYLLDADTLIRADNTYYSLQRFPVFWEWLRYVGAEGDVKIPLEQYEEVVAGNGSLVDWLCDDEIKAALLLGEDADAKLVAQVITSGYAPDLTDAELETVGRDPFLIAYGCADPANRCIVSFENSSPRKQRANRKVPDVCAQLGVSCITLFQMIQLLDFTTDWKKPS